jgi:AhpD family alkylhydroperoxidase
MDAPRLSLAAIRSLGRALRHAPALRGQHIGPQLRERIILHVSSLNGCPVCSVAHGLVGRAVGLDRQDIRAARSCDPPAELDERTRIAMRFAELVVLDEHDDEAERRFDETFSHAEQEEIRAIVDLFVFNNRANNTWEAALPGARWRRRALGLCDRDD